MAEIPEKNSEQEWCNAYSKFWETHQEKREPFSQYEPLLISLYAKVEGTAREKNINIKVCEVCLRVAGKILEDITDALKAYWKDPPKNRFWYHFDLSQLASRPEEWTEISPISPELLDAATAKYLEQPWMQSNQIDWYILNGFIVDTILRVKEGMFSGVTTGRIDWAYIIAGSNFLRFISWRVGFSAAKFAMKWLLLPLFAASAYYIGYDKAAMWASGILGLIVLFRIIMFPLRFMRRRTLKKQMADLEDMLKRLISIHSIAKANTWNPTLLRERLIEIEKSGNPILPAPAVYSFLPNLFWHAMYSVLDRAIQRDPSVFTIEGRKSLL